MTITNALILTTGHYAQWMDYLTFDLKTDLEKQNISVHEIDLSTLPQSQIPAILDDLATPQPDRLLISFNGRVAFPEQGRDGKAYKLGCPHFHWIVDSPAHYYTPLSKLPDDTLIGVVDPSHTQMMAGLGLKHHTLYFPHQPDRPIKIGSLEQELGERLLFAGNFPLIPDEASMVAQNQKEVATYIHAVWRAAHRQAKECCATYNVLEEECQGAGVELGHVPAPMLSGLLLLLEKLSCSFARMRVLDILSDDFQIDVIGDKNDHPMWQKENIQVNDKLPFEEICQKMKTAKAVLNITPKFPTGATERVWQTIKHGGVILSNPARSITGLADEGIIQCLDLSLSDEILRKQSQKLLSEAQIMKCREKLIEKVEVRASKSRVKKLLDTFNQ